MSLGESSLTGTLVIYQRLHRWRKYCPLQNCQQLLLEGWGLWCGLTPGTCHAQKTVSPNSPVSPVYSLPASSSVMFSKPEVGDSNDPLITEHSASPYTQHFNQLRLCSYHHPLQEEASLTKDGMLAATFRTLGDFQLLLFQYWRPAPFYLPPEPPLINISSSFSLKSQASTDWSTFAFSFLWFWDLHSSF